MEIRNHNKLQTSRREKVQELGKIFMPWMWVIEIILKPIGIPSLFLLMRNYSNLILIFWVSYNVPQMLLDISQILLSRDGYELL